MTIILHVGAAKCGSSSLQTLLSSRPLLSADDGSAAYEYVCITNDGVLCRREDLQNHARLTPYEAQVSAPVDGAWACDPAALKRLSLQFKEVLAEGRTPVVSQEAWFKQAERFHLNNILPQLGLRARVVAFVRPQVSWLNSAWWQWGAWSSHEFSDWIEGTKDTIKWTEQIGAWKTVPGVDTVEIHLGNGDVVSSFLRSIGVSMETPRRRNASLDQNLLNYLRRRTDLRSVHTPLVDFVLEQQLAGNAKGAPWVMQPEQISDLIAYYRADNRILQSLLSSEAAQAMENDPMWWHPAAYIGRQAVPAERTEPSIAALEDISDRAIDAVIRLDQRVRMLEASQRVLTRTAESALHELALATGKPIAREVPIPPRLRKAISINGIRRLVGV